ncbi:MAG: HAMP domain-containing histidine kinase [Actinomycetia bacterium]|nr:HAMP domain-containing histidine kinase [Actinomycetes bacterium]
MSVEDLRDRKPRLLSSWRLRLVGWNVLLVLVSAIASLFVLRTIVLIDLDQTIEADFQQEVDELFTLASGNDPNSGQPFNHDARRVFEVFLDRNLPGEYETFQTFVGGQPFRQSSTATPLHLEEIGDTVREWTSVDQSARGNVQTSNGKVDYLAVRLDGAEPAAVFVVTAFTDLRRRNVERPVALAAATELGVGLTIAAMLAWTLTRRMVRPVTELTSTVRRITAGDLGQRVPVTGDDELARLAATFNEMLIRLEDAFTAQQRFLADAGHELRTPITVVRGHLELMSDTPAERAQTIDLVTSELDRMARLVQDLLTLARSERHDFLSRRRVDLDILTTDIIHKAEALGDRRWGTDEIGLGVVDIDPDRLTQAAMALAENAVWHTEPTDEINIGSRLTDHDVELWIRDTGVGIPPEELGSIFKRFHRGRGARQRPGSGLGLAIVAGIAEAHGGSATVKSSPGRGSTFTIHIPSAPESKAQDDQ